MYSAKGLQEEREDILSSYIDALNNDKKPNYEDIFKFEEDEELIQMLETVCVVKRLKEDYEEEFNIMRPEKIKAQTRNNKKSKNRRAFFSKLLATAAMAVILLSGGLAYQNSTNSKEAKNIAYATIKQYNSIHNFKGTLVENLYNKDSKTTQKIQIQYLEPNQFYAIHETENGTLKKLYKGGDTLYEFDQKGKLTMHTVTEDTLKFELSTYRADKKIKERVENVKNAKLLGEEKVAGRNAQVYEFYYEDKDIKHKMWIDKELGISLKEDFQDGKGVRIISEFVDFNNDINVMLPDVTDDQKNNSFDERITEEQKAKEEQLKNTKSGFKAGQILDVSFMGLADSNSGEFKVGKDYFVFGITEKLKDKFAGMKSGKNLKVLIDFEAWTTNPVIKEIK
ncbi:hypothetical protein CLHOM_34680 [Clostridium homopropionicum DSM 5847]|uniref:MucB/RseB N-terminal domain-containing protein n=1 Tax=Clostridium homopropionicum DSM 5847 TaxID=1121318 RepID=A0A0L6Z6I1_9CLOT|nr:sigma-E factor regulatory protein RseB domain-containing protein [Clostridium homopropionicum]KOA18566.1 hypothetical protein CLHOM_34680 [Clostridium homopropionicum DSM 5847]SFF64711.1 Outer membrane lipoprotein-sorting protein [Clostridium homopropionicum]